MLWPVRPIWHAFGMLVVTAQEQRKDQGRNRRHKGDDGKKVVHQFAPPLSVIHVTRTAIPITMAKA